MPQRTSLKKLSDIAKLRTGYTFREKIEEVTPSSGNAHIAQIKDVREIAEGTNSFLLEPARLPLINWQGKTSAFVSPGAVLLPARGSKGGYFRASCLVPGGSASLPVVVSSQFLVITPSECLLPEFLCWALNQSKIQHSLAEGSGSQGSNIVMLSTKLANELILEVPSLETQKKILNLNTLWEREQKLTQALLDNRERMLNGMFQQLLKEDK